MVSATLPHSQPKENIFQPPNGNYILTMTANPLIGLPSGSTARLILIWLTTEAVKKKSLEIKLGKSFSSFLKKLEMRNSGGKRGNATRVREQMMRLLSCNISCTYIDKKKAYVNLINSHISRSFKLWWNPLQPEAKGIFKRFKDYLGKRFLWWISKMLYTDRLWSFKCASQITSTNWYLCLAHLSIFFF